MVPQVFNSSTCESGERKVGLQQVSGQPGLHSSTVSQKAGEGGVQFGDFHQHFPFLQNSVLKVHEAAFTVASFLPWLEIISETELIQKTQHREVEREGSPLII